MSAYICKMSQFTESRQFTCYYHGESPCYYIPYLLCCKELVYEDCYHATQRVIFIRLQQSCLKSLFFLSTPLFVLKKLSGSPCRNARTHSFKASQLCKLTFAKTLISIVQLNVNSTETQWSGNPL